MSTLVDILGTIVATLRATGTVDDTSEASGITTITSANSLEANEVVTMGSVDYRVLTASSTQFTVTGTGIVASTWIAKAPYYDYGHPLEIINTLKEKGGNDTKKYEKYPLIWLWLDYDDDVTVSTRTKHVIAENLIIVIMTETKKNYKAENRYDNVFVPILIPLYDSLMSAILESSQVHSDDKYHHKKKNRLYWGKEDLYGNVGNIGNDALDAVIVSGLDLRLDKCN